jgi:hypothetical protein
MLNLLVLDAFGVGALDSSEHGSNDYVRMQQFVDRGERCSTTTTRQRMCSIRLCAVIGPRGWHQYACAIRQNDVGV